MTETVEVTTSLIEQIKQQTEEFNRQRKELVNRLKADFHGLFKEVFEQYPEISHFRWAQYTPYFNDGDSCEFSRHEINAFTAEDDGGYWEEAEGLIEDGRALVAWKQYLETGTFPDDFCKYYTLEQAVKGGFESREAYILSNGWNVPSTVRALKLEDMDRATEVAIAAQGMINALEQIPEDMYEDLFGDHVNVIVSRGGVEVEEYDHD